jgi:hypothetical protein
MLLLVSRPKFAKSDHLAQDLASRTGYYTSAKKDKTMKQSPLSFYCFNAMVSRLHPRPYPFLVLSFLSLAAIKSIRASLIYSSKIQPSLVPLTCLALLSPTFANSSGQLLSDWLPVLCQSSLGLLFTGISELLTCRLFGLTIAQM